MTTGADVAPEAGILPPGRVSGAPHSSQNAASTLATVVHAGHTAGAVT
ncbi:hypothetical protein [Salana multivorans]